MLARIMIFLCYIKVYIISRLCDLLYRFILCSSSPRLVAWVLGMSRSTRVVTCNMQSSVELPQLMRRCRLPLRLVVTVIFRWKSMLCTPPLSPSSMSSSAGSTSPPGRSPSIRKSSPTGDAKGMSRIRAGSERHCVGVLLQVVLRKSRSLRPKSICWVLCIMLKWGRCG